MIWNDDNQPQIGLGQNETGQMIHIFRDWEQRNEITTDDDQQVRIPEWLVHCQDDDTTTRIVRLNELHV